jgi:hypothetical protein
MDRIKNVKLKIGDKKAQRKQSKDFYADSRGWRKELVVVKGAQQEETGLASKKRTEC